MDCITNTDLNKLQRDPIGFLRTTVVLARVFWFKDPLIGVSTATLLYVAGFIYAFVRR